MSFKKNRNKITYFQLSIGLGCLTTLIIFILAIYESVKNIGSNSQRSECYNPDFSQESEKFPETLDTQRLQNFLS